jgi:hypothetical protein
MVEGLSVFTDYLLKKGIDQEKGKELIMGSQKIGDIDKLLVYSYCYPRKIGDYELPSIIMNYRKSHGIDIKGLLSVNPEEACILVEAYKSLQYGRFMRHLMHAFIEKPETISSVAGEGEDKCPICGKPVLYVESHDRRVDPNDESLAFISSESSVCMCKDCLVQLAYSAELISKIEGPDFLTSWKPSPKPDFTSEETPNP